MHSYLFKLIIILLLIYVKDGFAVNSAAENSAKKINFLVLSDIHFDPFADCAKSQCPIILKLKSTPVKDWAGIFASLNAKPSLYRRDTNFALFSSTLAAAKQAAAQNQVEYVYILGDFLGHDLRRYYKKYTADKTQQGYQQFIKKTLDFMSMQIANTFPNLDVFAVVGNNDTYHRDYFVAPNGQFLKDMQVSWSQLIKNIQHKNQMQKTFSQAGYYAIEFNHPSLRLIMLNSVLFSPHFRDRNGAIFAEQQIRWLQAQLQSAHDKHQKVIISMHIPMGLDVYITLRMRLFTLVHFWQKQYMQAFQKLLSNYAEDIIAIIAGHLHSDWFQMITFPNSQYEFPSLGAPAISPLIGNNPSFKIYSYSLETNRLDNFKTYFFPINQNGPWKIEYDFHASFVPPCKYCDIIEIFNQIKS